MLQAIAGPYPLEPQIVPVEARGLSAAALELLRPGLRMAYCPNIARTGIDPEIKRVIQMPETPLHA